MKTQIAYKLFKVRNNKLYPLYIYANEELKQGVWLQAKMGELASETHVKSKLGKLALRGGYHLANIPCFAHIGKKQNGELVMSKDTVICECEYNINTDYTEKVRENGFNKKGTFIPSKAYMREIPKNGFYFYKTNTNADDNIKWIITSDMKINRVLTNEEIDVICLANGIEPQKRETEN